MKLAVSTAAFSRKTIKEIIEIAEKNALIVEFGSNVPFQPDMEDIYRNCRLKRLIHNYFPSYESPFVLNLASGNETVRKSSVAHCINGLKLAKFSNSPFFSAHAGFCIDPEAEDLGKCFSDINNDLNFDRQYYWDLFLMSIKEIIKSAENIGVDFLIENNVLIRSNTRKDGNNLLFCVEPFEMEKLIKEINNPRLGILLDTAHLKISSRTLNFDPGEALKVIKPYVKAIHHSDNNGIKDNNEPVNGKYWFLKNMKMFENNTGIWNILEVKALTIDQIKHQYKILNKESGS